MRRQVVLYYMLDISETYVCCRYMCFSHLTQDNQVLKVPAMWILSTLAVLVSKRLLKSCCGGGRKTSPAGVIRLIWVVVRYFVELNSFTHSPVIVYQWSLLTSWC